MCWHGRHQLCRAFGSPCFVTAGSAEKIARCLDLGAEGGCHRHSAQFAHLVEEWTAGEGMDVILDPVDGSYLGDNLKSLGLGGRLVLIGLMGRAEAQELVGRNAPAGKVVLEVP